MSPARRKLVRMEKHRPIDRALRWARERNMNNTQFAAALGVESQHVTNWLKRGMPAARHAQVANLFGKTVDELLGRPGPVISSPPLIAGEETNTRSLHVRIGLVPLLTWAQAGEPMTAPNGPAAPLAWLPCPVPHGKNTFALKVSGDSMFNPTGKPSYSDGDVIFVDPDRTPQPGERCVVRLSAKDGVTFKQLVIEDGRRLLKALNPEWTPRYIELAPTAVMIGLVIGKWVGEA